MSIIKEVKFTPEHENLFVGQMFPQTGYKRPVRVKVNGAFVRMKSSKACWSSIGAAKLALKTHLSNQPTAKCIYRILAEEFAGSPYAQEEGEIYKAFIDHLQKRGILEFVQE